MDRPNQSRPILERGRWRQRGRTAGTDQLLLSWRETLASRATSSTHQVSPFYLHPPFWGKCKKADLWNKSPAIRPTHREKCGQELASGSWWAARCPSPCTAGVPRGDPGAAMAIMLLLVVVVLAGEGAAASW